MDYISDINIYEAVIHVLDINADKAVLNEFALDLNDELYTFILRHLTKVVKDEALRHAKFKEDAGKIKEVTQKYLNGQGNIIDMSQEVAKYMFSLMKSSGNIPSCDLMVVSFSCELGLMIAILKLDYIKNYMHTIDLEEGKVGINIIPQYTGLPHATKKVNKCALIKRCQESAENDLLFIDKASKNVTDNYGAEWFLKEFIECAEVSSDRVETKDFCSAVESWTRANLSENADKAEEVRRIVRNNLKEYDEIDTQELMGEVLGNEGAIDFMNYTEKLELPEKIRVDKNWLEKKNSKLKLKVDSDIELTIKSEAYNDDTRFEVIRNGDGTVEFRIKNIRNYIEK